MGIHNYLEKKLDTNIVSIVIAALIVIIIASWAKFIKNLFTDTVKDHRENRFEHCTDKFWFAFILTVIGLFVIIIIYEWWKMTVDN